MGLAGPISSSPSISDSCGMGDMVRRSSCGVCLAQVDGDDDDKAAND